MFEEKLEALVHTARNLEGVWDGDFIAEYPHDLPSFDELVALLAQIRVKTREEALRDAMYRNGLPEGTAFIDHPGVLYVHVNASCAVGIDWCINEEWQLVLYLDQDHENWVSLTPGLETGLTNDMDIERVCEVVLPIIMGLRGEA